MPSADPISPTIDVLIPVFNAEKTVRSAVESMLAQTAPISRVIIVDDGSTDDTPFQLEALGRQDVRVHLIRQANGGIVSALNAGLELCRADYVARHDADDLAYVDRLERQCAYLRENADCVAIGCEARHIDRDGRPTGTFTSFKDPNAADPAFAPALEPYLLHPFLVVRRQALIDVGGYRFVYHAEDADLYWRLQEVGRLHNLRDVLGDYRLHEGSISGQSIGNGRIMSLTSQLCAISAMRRRSGRADLEFFQSDIAAYRAATSMLALQAVAKPRLSLEEARHLAAAMSAKLLGFAGYRPYELELADCAEIRRAFVHDTARLSTRNRRAFAAGCCGAAARLASKGMWREAKALLGLRLLAGFAARLLLRRLLPSNLHVHLKEALQVALRAGGSRAR